ncbi:MAG: SUMF1/EgtB/PvdO family nonheme iron enzyme, partial [Phycisphaerae bacterium]|nr:SUMF1/EgtB/PvdO family nonheme iron enzyme [Phycisphaerae bacterium]
NAALLAVNRNSNWKWAITSEDEWYKAAYYDPTTSSYCDYPTRSNAAPGRDLNDVSGNNANYYGSPFPLDSPYPTTVVGQFDNSASPYGTFDQGGNVWEWNEAVIGSHRGLRGGSFGDYVGVVGLHASVCVDDNPAYESNVLGFRVVEVPEPCSAALLLAGAVGFFRRRLCR